ncbi:MAG: hypothetical protein WCG35_10460 [Betaproteobacteria bacterium]
MEEDEDYDYLLQGASLSCMEEMNSLLNCAETNFFSATGKNLPKWRQCHPSNKIDDSSILVGGYKIPKGSLFYPCSGRDVVDAIKFFGDRVNEYHFSDPFHPLFKTLNRDVAPKISDVINLPSIGNIVLHEGGVTKKPAYGQPSVFHQKDGVFTLIDDITNMSVFYYRGDSQGEGGSGQNWLGPVLFDLVLSRLMNGGLICTDGANGSGEIYHRLMKLEVNEAYHYRNLVIKRLDVSLPAKRLQMFVWQVHENSYTLPSTE